MSKIIKLPSLKILIKIGDVVSIEGLKIYKEFNNIKPLLLTNSKKNILIIVYNQKGMKTKVDKKHIHWYRDFSGKDPKAVKTINLPTLRKLHKIDNINKIEYIRNNMPDILFYHYFTKPLPDILTNEQENIIILLNNIQISLRGIED